MANRNTHYFVKNLNGTTGKRCGCRSWLEHWQNYTKSTRIVCAIEKCGNYAEVGAHVAIDDYRFNRQWWIVPFCKFHNHPARTEPLTVALNVELVSANKHITCYIDF